MVQKSCSKRILRPASTIAMMVLRWGQPVTFERWNGRSNMGSSSPWCRESPLLVPTMRDSMCQGLRAAGVVFWAPAETNSQTQTVSGIANSLIFKASAPQSRSSLCTRTQIGHSFPSFIIESSALWTLFSSVHAMTCYAICICTETFKSLEQALRATTCSERPRKAETERIGATSQLPFTSSSRRR